MSLTSSLNNVEDALLALLQARAATVGSALAGVTIQLGDPGGRLEPEHIYIDEAAEATQQWDVTKQEDGTGQREEAFDLHVVIWTSALDDDYTTLRTRGSALEEEVEAAVAGDVTIGGTAWFAEVAGFVRGSAAYEDHRAMLFDVRVAITNYLA